MFLELDKKPPEKTAAKDDLGNQVTYGELIREKERVAGLVPRRSLVFLLCRNDVASLKAYIGTVLSGSVPLLLDTNVQEPLLERLLDVYRPQFIYRDGEFQATGEPAYELHEDLELLLPTSGSTGSPKLVRYGKGNLDVSARNTARAYGWTAEERPLCDLPMHYTMGLNVINMHLYVGATLLLMTRRVTHGLFWQFALDERATSFTGVPFSYEVFFKLKVDRMELPDLKTFCEGGGRLSEETFRRLVELTAAQGKRFVASFGTTETSSRIALLPPQEAATHILSIGKAIPGGELALYDGEEELLEPAATGELVFRGPVVTLGYAATKADLAAGDVFRGEFRTGDIARRDADGFYYIIGRRSRFLKLLGHRVDLNECEELIKKEFGCDAACAGDDNQMRIYVTDPAGAEQAEIREADVRNFISRLTGVNASKFAVSRIAALPRNSYGKIIYAEL